MQDRPFLLHDSLPRQEWIWIRHRWIAHALHADSVLCKTGCVSRVVWFLDDAITARIARGEGARREAGASLEIGLDAPGSVTCAFAVSGLWRAPWDVKVRRAGQAHALGRPHLDGVQANAPMFAALCRQLVQEQVRELAAHYALTRRTPARSIVADRLEEYFAAYGDAAIRITHGELAERLNLRRATVTLALQELEGLGAIRSLRGRIVLADAAALKDAALREVAGQD